MVAPAKAPTPPGTAMIPTVRQSTLPSFQCETPETRVVPISETVHSGRRRGRRDAGGQQQRRRRHAVRHPERAVDDLGEQAHEGEDDQCLHA